MKWYDYLKSTKQVTGTEDLMDTLALMIVMGLVVLVVFL